MTVDWDSVPNPPRYYNMNGEGISLREWLKLSERLGDHDPMRVALTKRDDVEVSTVLLGLDHRFGRQGPPLIFETMIFGGDHDEYLERYATKEEALAGHARACALAFGDLAVVEEQTMTTQSAYPDRDPDLFYELARDRLGTQLETIDALDNKIGLLVSLASALLGILAAVIALSVSQNDESLGVASACVLAAAAFCYVILGWAGIRAYRCRSWDVGPNLRQVWDDAWGDADDALFKWEVARDLWAYYDDNYGAQKLKSDALVTVVVGVVIQSLLVVAALVLVAVEV